MNYNQAWRNYRKGSWFLYGMIGLNTAGFFAWQYGLSAEKERTKDPRIQPLWPVSVPKDSTVPGWMVRNMTFSVDGLKEGRWWTTITKSFSHNSLPHFAFNMISLHAFAGILIQAIAPQSAVRHLAALTIGSALSSSYALYLQVKSGNNATLNRYSRGLGASDVVMGFGAAVAFLRPRQMMVVFVLPMPMWVLFPAYVAVDFYYLNDERSRVGHSAHLGGAAFGAVYYFLALRRFGGLLGKGPRALGW